ncbi:MAG TPA: hypothetical protein VMV15_04340 [Candidatus Binataceae bacterium]|nr:hypothetical protein [Candidatus Binataceae bacterium]
MQQRAESRFRYQAGRRALAIAALLLSAQFLALAHVHPFAFDKGFHANAQVVANDGLCALCLLHFNCPASASPPIVVARPPLVEALPIATASSPLRSSVKTCLFGRAPPAAL